MVSPLWNVPNLLTLSRLPLSALIFVAIQLDYWWWALGFFVVASLTDWLDGWWARRYDQGTPFGRAADPLIDKVMILGGFVFLMTKPESRLSAWMVAAMLAREFLITGLRGYMESIGVKFGADWFGKLKMFLQCILFGYLLFFLGIAGSDIEFLVGIQIVLIYVTILATIGSGVQYLVRSWPHLQK
jgi:CDP-diacylglycerol--glycerol-3-phosphate 3-phosphatidyltransferase